MTINRYRLSFTALLLSCVLLHGPTAVADEREDFRAAWEAARKGRIDALRQAIPRLSKYSLQPYLIYEDYRTRRRTVSEAEMVDFLARHEGWGFHGGLKTVWLRELGRSGRWDALLRHVGTSRDTELRCHKTRAMALKGRGAEVLDEARSLWLVGSSQHDACDPVFAWLRKEGHMTKELVWGRITKALEAGNPTLARYLRYDLSPDEQRELEGYLRLFANTNGQGAAFAKTSRTARSHQMLEIALTRLARRDANQAWFLLQSVDAHLSWGNAHRGAVLHDIGVFSALALEPDALKRIAAVPDSHRSEQLAAWEVRAALGAGDWSAVLTAIATMPESQRADSRWRYWRARALDRLGQAEEADRAFRQLALEAHYEGFLAADRLNEPYQICESPIAITDQKLAELKQHDGLARAFELRAVGLDDFANREWQLAIASLSDEDLRHAASLARDVDWHDRSVFALARTGNRTAYEWRFPLAFEPLVLSHANSKQLDPAWVFGIMRSESALNPRAISGANAYGLMQVLPTTARKLAAAEGLRYRSREQLLLPEFNIPLGTAYLRQLMDRFGDKPFLVAGAYNAGPAAVERWLKEQRATEPDIWIELIPYFETRDYIPRVMAFSTLYNWRLGQPVQRISNRLPSLSPGKSAGAGTATVECAASG